MKKSMPLQKSQTVNRKPQPYPHTSRLLTQEIIPIIDKAMYDKVYPSRFNSKSQLEYGLTDSELNLLPKPNFSIVPDYCIKRMASFPNPYIQFVKCSRVNLDNTIEYDMDEEDMAWLGIMNEERKNGNIVLVEPKTFEFLMDLFEKECRFDRQTFYEGKIIEEISDDEAVCSVCTGGASLVMNEILFCDLCNIGIHQECYGVPYIPEGSWICRRCFHSPSQLLNCVLCPNASGAFKQTDRRFWCHIVCAIWIPEVHFTNSTFIDPIYGIERIPSSRWNLTCSICNIKDVGACLKCKYRTCRVAFHVSCAQYAGYAMMMTVDSSAYRKQRIHGIYCPKHIPGNERKIQLENTNHINDLKPNVVQSLRSNIILIPHIPPEKIKDIADQVEFEKKNVFIRRLLSYWSLKRHVRSGVPMIPSRSFGLEQETEKKELSPLEQQEMDRESIQKDKAVSYQKLNLIRQDLEKVRNLCGLVRAREELKSEHALIKYKCIECQFAPLIIYLRNFIQELIELDTDNLFSKAVDGSEAVTSRPTDFVQIRSKIDSLQYSSLQQFEYDFQEMISSRITCYGRRTKIYKSAMKLKENSKDKFLEAYKEVAAIEKQIKEHRIQWKDQPDDYPELHPEIKDESYENPSSTEIPAELDYYGEDTGQPASLDQTINKNLRKETKNVKSQLPIVKFSTDNDEDDASSSLAETMDVVNKKPIRIKIMHKRRSQIALSGGRDHDAFSHFSTSPVNSTRKSGVNRRTSILFTKNQFKPTQKEPPAMKEH